MLYICTVVNNQIIHLKHTTHIMENIQQLISEAEERGYIRGCNEQIEKQMQSPGLWQDPASASPPTDSTFPILSSPRHSIWDIKS